MKKLTLFIFLFLLIACDEPTAVTPAPPPTATPQPTIAPPIVPDEVSGAAFDSPEYGMHLSQWWHLEYMERDLDLVKEMGFGWVKQKFPWRDLEKEDNGYDWYFADYIVDAVEQRDLKLMVRLDAHPLWSVAPYLPPEQITASQPPGNYADFGDYCHDLATRYAGRIHAYQVWNEPNLSREWGENAPNPYEYVLLLKECYEGIKTADPSAIVITAGLAPTGTQPPLAMPADDFLRAMYEAGAAPYFDVLGVHAPGFNNPPEASPEGEAGWQTFRYVEKMREIMVEYGDADKQIAILEMGWMLNQEYHPSYTWHGVTEQQQADYLVGAYQYAQENWQPWIGVMNSIYFADTDWQPEANEQYWWSIVLPDGTKRPAYDALKEMPK